MGSYFTIRICHLIAILFIIQLPTAVYSFTEPPFINYIDDELIVKPGWNISIHCSGILPVFWIYQSVLAQQPPIEDRINITIKKTSNEDGSQTHESTLMVENLMWADTGNYICSYTEDPSGPLKTSIYVYVADPGELFASPNEGYNPQHEMFIPIITQGIPSVIPCKPTHPEIQVILRKDGADIQLTENLTYDPQIGFTIQTPVPFYSNIFMCVASHNGVTSTITAVLQYMVSTDAPTPELKVTHKNALVGENITMTCTAGTDLDKVLFMDWSYPAMNQTTSRVHTTDSIRTSIVVENQSYAKYHTEINVYDVHQSDKGIYTCTVTNQSSRKKSISSNLYVRDKTFITMAPAARNVTANIYDPDVILAVTITAYPPPLKLTWMKNGLELQEADRRYEIKYRGDKCKLRIFSPVQADAGSYTLFGYSHDMNTSTSVSLVIEAPPQLTMKILPRSGQYFLRGSHSQIECQVSAYPEATITWYWKTCDTYLCQSHDGRVWDSISLSGNQAVVRHEGNTSHLTLIAMNSGFLRCVASNNVGTREAVTPFFVNDNKDGFVLTGEKTLLSPVIGDMFSLKCTVNKLGFSEPTMYWIHDDQKMPLLPLDINDELNGQSDWSANSTQTEYSHILTVTWDSFEAYHVGTYQCEAEDHDGVVNAHHAVVKVKDPLPLVFAKPLNGKINVEPGSNHILECTANGLPHPNIHWFHDGNPLEGSERLTIDNNGTRIRFEKVTHTDAGTYTCEASNRIEKIYSNLSMTVQVLDENALTPAEVGVIIAVVMILLIIGITILLFILRRKFGRNKNFPVEYLLAGTGAYNPDIPIEEQSDCVGYDKEMWEFPRENLEFGELLGQGAFGKVVKAIAMDIQGLTGPTEVAVKMPRDYSDNEQLKALISELKVLIHIGHHVNILNLMGACTESLQKGVLHVIVEYCSHGNLRNFLLKKRDCFVDTLDRTGQEEVLFLETSLQMNIAGVNGNQNREGYVNQNVVNGIAGRESIKEKLTTKDLACFAYQIARGMEFLSARKYIHRDLAARNILLTDKNVVKIADFGLAKDCYKYSAYQKKTNGPVPVKWMALESLTHRIYTTQSDVWSYGITLWEIFTIGGSPYPAVEIDESFVEMLKNGYRMDKPSYANDQIYHIIQTCWYVKPEMRPDFSDLVTFFGNLLHESVKKHYLELDVQYASLPPSAPDYFQMQGSISSSDYMPMSPKSAKNHSESVPDTYFSLAARDIGLANDDVWLKRRNSLPSHEWNPLVKIPENKKITLDENVDNLGYLEPTTRLNGLVTPPAVIEIPKDTFDEHLSSPTSSHSPSSDGETIFNSEIEGIPKRAPSGRVRGKPYKGNGSVTSEASSGFHSDYVPYCEDSSIQYASIVPCTE